ncbi:MAG: hypothetical protein Q4C47_09840, partial [Planctomycetia bacterium]|nr:hypothetical protein [Planctomycetia bacterium]
MIEIIRTLQGWPLVVGLVLIVAGVGVAVGAWLSTRFVARPGKRWEKTPVRQCLQFRREREHLEAKLAGFGRFAAIHGLPYWEDITFDDPVYFLWDYRTGELLALVAILLEIRSPDPARSSDLCFQEFGGGSGDSDETDDYSRASLAAESLAAIRENRENAENRESPERWKRTDDEPTVIPPDTVEDGPYRWRFRDATAIFRYQNEAWSVDTRVVPDLSPEDVIRFHGNRFRLVPESRPVGTNDTESDIRV